MVRIMGKLLLGCSVISNFVYIEYECINCKYYLFVYKVFKFIFYNIKFYINKDYEMFIMMYFSFFLSDICNYMCIYFFLLVWFFFDICKDLKRVVS